MKAHKVNIMKHTVHHGMLVAFRHINTIVKKGVYKSFEEINAEVQNLQQFYKQEITYQILRKT